MTRYAHRVEQESTISLLPASGVHRGKFRRRPPNSETETKRRQAWGKEWGKVGAEYAARLRAKEKR